MIAFYFEFGPIRPWVVFVTKLRYADNRFVNMYNGNVHREEQRETRINTIP